MRFLIEVLLWKYNLPENHNCKLLRLYFGKRLGQVAFDFAAGISHFRGNADCVKLEYL
jgi:hypothetical protein